MRRSVPSGPPGQRRALRPVNFFRRRREKFPGEFDTRDLSGYMIWADDTAVGIAIGLACAGLRIPLHAVRVVHETVGSRRLAARLLAKTVRLLRTLDDIGALVIALGAAACDALPTPTTGDGGEAPATTEAELTDDRLLALAGIARRRRA